MFTLHKYLVLFRTMPEHNAELEYLVEQPMIQRSPKA